MAGTTRHFVAYHSVDVMGEELDITGDPSDVTWTFATRKPKRFLEANVVGSRLWLISGDKDRRGERIYRLHGYYVPEEIGPSRGDFFSQINGSEGRALPRPVKLNGLEWFEELRRSQNNFSFGITEIRQKEAIRALEALMRSTGRNSVSQQQPKPADAGPVDRERREISRLMRKSALAKRVVKMHEGVCQLCGEQLLMPGRDPYAEVHHLQPLGRPHNGPDILTNMICVCPNCHARLDYGATKISRRQLHQVDGHSINSEYVDYHNTRIYRKE